jgi:sodium transport system permease protein
MGPAAGGAVVRAVLANELKRLLRDRKALALALLLPMALYPLMFWGSRELGRVSQSRLEEAPLRALVDLSALPAELSEAVEAELEGLGEKLERTALDFGDPRLRTEREQRARELLDADGEDPAPQVLVLGVAGGLGPRVLLFHRGTDEQSLDGTRRLEERLEALAKRQLESQLVLRLGQDPAAAWRAERVDLAPARDRAGASLGRFLPLVLALVLLSGGAFAALDAFAAERELGTLETLLVQPVRAREVALGKFLAVLGTALLTWAGNAASLLACAGLGLFDPSDLAGRGASEGLTAGLDPALFGRLLVGLFLFLPSAALLAALLCLVSARAKSFREGQQLIMPLSLLVMALTGPAALPTLELSPLFAALPLLGPALAMRDALVGQLGLWMGLWTLLASLPPLLLALSQISGTLDAERLLREERPKGDLALGERQRRLAQNAGIALALGLWLLGGSWTSEHGLVGRGLALLATAAFGLWLAGHVGRSGDPAQGLGRALGWAPRARGAVLLHGALLGLLLALLGPKLALLAQQGPSGALYPAAERLAAASDALGTGTRVLWLVLLPALAQELCFRGALLGALARGPRLSALLLSALLFAVAEGSFLGLPQALLLGLAAGAARLSGGGLGAALAVHLLARGLPLLPAFEAAAAGLPDAQAAALALLGLGSSAWLLRRPPGPALRTAAQAAP